MYKYVVFNVLASKRSLAKHLYTSYKILLFIFLLFCTKLFSSLLLLLLLRFQAHNIIMFLYVYMHWVNDIIFFLRTSCMHFLFCQLTTTSVAVIAVLFYIIGNYTLLKVWIKKLHTRVTHRVSSLRETRCVTSVSNFFIHTFTIM